MKNQAGKFVEPTFEAFASAAAGADWKNAPAMYMVLTDQPGEKSWPITGAIVHPLLQGADRRREGRGGAEVLRLVLQERRRDAAKELYYVPIPAPVYQLVEAKWREDVTSNGQPVWK